MPKQQLLYTVNAANYVTLIHPGVHPDRIMEEHDLLYMIEGQWQIDAEQADGKIQTFHIESGDLLILPAGRHHYGNTLCSPNNKHMYIHVNTLLHDSIYDYKTLIHCQDNPRISQLYSEIIATFWNDISKENKKALKRSYLFALLLLELSDQQNKPYPAFTGKNIVSEAVRLIQSTPQSFYTSKELADHFFVCERTLTNQFKKNYGKSLYAYQLDMKLEMVCLFLKNNPQVKLREAALNFGFCDEFHLSKAFKKKYGIAPSVYRNQIKFT